LPEPANEPSVREIEMARQLVATLSTTFDPEKYRDEYREELLALIDKKAAGEEIITHAAPEEPGKVLDLMAALEASLARSGARQAARSRDSDADVEIDVDVDADAAPAPRSTAKAAPRTTVRKAVKSPASAKTGKQGAPAKAAKKSAAAKPVKRAKKSA
jgi:DNA end-binding protein Ku